MTYGGRMLYDAERQSGTDRTADCSAIDGE